MRKNLASLHLHRIVRQTRQTLTFPAAGRPGESRWERRFGFVGGLRFSGGRGDLGVEIVVFRETLELIDEHQRVLRRDLELLPAGPARHLVVEPQEVIAQLRKFRAILVVGTGRQAVLLHTADPPDVVLIRAPAPGTLIPSRAGFRLFRKEGAFIECHVHDCSNERTPARKRPADGF